MSAVTVTFVGSGDAFGSGGRFQTCILVRADNLALLLDCGASSLVALKKFEMSPAAVDTILVTHLHGDHFGGIPFFILDAQFSRREHALRIAGPPGLKDRLRTTMEALFPRSSEIQQRFPLDLIELQPRRPISFGAVRVTAYPVEHFCGAPPYALRLEANGRVISYSGDTEWTETLLEAASGADLFICEAYFLNKKVKFHLDYETLSQHRDKLGCKRLVLTHMSQDMLDHAPGLPVECAHDGKSITL